MTTQQLPNSNNGFVENYLSDGKGGVDVRAVIAAILTVLIIVGAIAGIVFGVRGIIHLFSGDDNTSQSEEIEAIEEEVPEDWRVDVDGRFYTENLKDVDIDNGGWYGAEDDMCHNIGSVSARSHMPFWLTVQEPADQKKLREKYFAEAEDNMFYTIRREDDCFGFSNNFPRTYYWHNNGHLPIVLEYKDYTPGGVLDVNNPEEVKKLVKGRDAVLAKIDELTKIPDLDGVYGPDNPRIVKRVTVKACGQYAGDYYTQPCYYEYNVTIDTNNPSAKDEDVSLTLRDTLPDEQSEYLTFLWRAGISKEKQKAVRGDAWQKNAQKQAEKYGIGYDGVNVYTNNNED